MFRDRKSESALCFVPEILVEFINRNVHRKKNVLEPTSYFIQGVCLLVDISGFTKLSGEYCSQGKGGIDDLQRATNGFMGKLVEIIYQFGGDIVKFAGDAIICVFSNHTGSPLNVRRSIGGTNGLRVSMASILVPQNSMSSMPMITINSGITPELILRVMRCARVLRDIQTDKLTVHVAMSCGEMCFGILGGFENRWECLISGPCIHQLSDCLDDAPSKEAVMSPQCADVLKDVQKANTVAFGPAHHVPAVFSKVETSLGTYEFQILALESGNFRIIEVLCQGQTDSVTLAVTKASPKSVFGVGSVEQQELIRRFVPVPIADELESAASLTYLAEIREVTTMFMKWDSYDAFNANKDLISLQPCFYEAQRILQSSGAYLRQFLVDDKGCVLIACWGMPHLSYLDNSYRAVTSAAQIKHELEKVNMNCSFGITTGDVYCGTVGSVLRMEYAAIGSVVNMSARLMGKAAGGILVDDATYTRLPSTLSEHLLKLDPIRVKGRDEPLQVYKYNTSGNVQVKEKVVGDHELSHMCRNTLLSLVMRMSYAATHSNPLAPPSCACDTDAANAGSGWFSWLNFSRAHGTSAGSCFPVVVIQGQEDSGRTIAISWLKSQALDHDLNMHCAKLTTKDAHMEYGMWRKIFTLLMPKDLFLNKTIQRIRIHELLAGMYPCSPKLARTQGFPVLKAVMGLTCSYARDAPNEPDDNSTGSITLHNKVPSVKLRLKPKAVVLDATLPTLDTLTQVFKYLLNLQTTLVVVQNIELVDAESMKLLINLMPHVTQSAFVCTALTEHDAPEMSARHNYFSFFETRTRDVGKMTPWTAHLPTLLAQGSATNIGLENYTPESVNRMLAEALGVPVVPPEIEQLVRDLSGDSYFWVREILQFIKEHGAEKFVSGLRPEQEKNSNTMSVSISVNRLNSVSRTGSINRTGSVGSVSGMGNSTSRLLGNAGGGRGLKRNPTVTERTSSRASFRTPNWSPQQSPSSARASTRLKNFIQPSTTRGSSLVQVQLDNLVLCRFESLSSTIQRILRTASIIGITFSYQDLHALLPTHLREQLGACLNVLLQQKWLYQDMEYETQYEFSHPLSHQIIYELTPSSERNNLHQAIADHIVDTYRNDRSQYAAICYHYQHCDADKALQYVILNTHLMLETADVFEYSDGLNLLSSMVVHCKTPQDVCVLQELVNSTKQAIESLDLSTAVPSAHSWLHYLKRWSVWHKSTTVVPTESHTSQKSTHSLHSHFNHSGTSTNVFSGSSNQNINTNTNTNTNTNNRSSNKSNKYFFGKNYSEDPTVPLVHVPPNMDNWSVEQRTQYVLLEQIRALLPQLQERFVLLTDEVNNRVELFAFSNM